MSSDRTGAAGRDRAGAGDVAVIGLAVRLPEADDVEQFVQNLRRGQDSVRELSTDRKLRTSLPLDQNYQLSAYLDDIDTFDHAFFGISKGEADNMAPQQRLLLEVTHQAVENAGYDPATLHGLRASVYVGDTKLEYDRLARTLEPTTVMGSHVSAMAGRISRFFGLRGPAAMVDSSCSSSLLAVHLAVNDLLLGEAELALACGVNLNLTGDRRGGGPDLGIRSADGKTRCFSAEAAGTGSGEAVATVLLKPLDRALRDGDLVHAVIKSVATNNVAGRSSTLTAPDSMAQAEVIEWAWQKAGVDPTTISYIEAHGTATRLGDPIEIDGIDLAFGRVTSRKQFCAVSSVKSNLGHTWGAAGVVGLVKAVLALRHRVLFPSLHAATLSPLIDFTGSAVVVTRELTAWEPACGVRRAGVSSFGLMGTNVHAVLEEAPHREDAVDRAEPPGRYWVPVSAKSATALGSNVAALKQWIDRRPDLRLQDVQRTLVSGRGHYSHRFCVTAADLAELSDALAAPQLAGAESGDAEGRPVVPVLLLSGRCTASADLTRALRRGQPHFDLLYSRCEGAAEAGVDGDARFDQFAFQYAFSGLLRHLGLEFRHVVGDRAGKHVIEASTGRVELAEAVRRARLDEDADATDLDARVDRLLDRLAGDQPVLFVEAGPLSTVSRALAERGAAGYRVVAIADRADGFATFLRDLYLGGANWQWGLTAGEGRRIELPSYQFQRVRCWLRDVDVPARSPLPADAVTGQAPVPPLDTLTSVVNVWKDVLGVPEVGPEASFFDLGGDSISGIQAINRLQATFDVELEEFAIADHPTPLALARHIDDTRRAAPSTARSPAVAPSSPEPFAASPGQLPVWLAAQFDGGSVAFNLSRSFLLAGRVDTDALGRAVGALAERHDALRASFTFVGGELVQQVAPAGLVTAPLARQLIDDPLPDRPRMTGLVREFAGRPFDLAAGPLLRVQLASFRADRHLLTVCTHHIVADGWSLELLVRDLAAFYAFFARGTPLALPPIRTSYREHLREQQHRADGSREDAAAYWLAQFEDVPSVLELPLRSGPAGAAFSGAYRGYVLPEPLWGRLKAFARAEGSTAFVSLLTAFAALLSRYSEQGELVLGTTIAGRHQESVEQLVGMLVRTVPLRVQVDADSSFRGLLGQVLSTFNDALHHLAYPYEELVHELQQRGLARSPHLFNVLIELERFAGSQVPPAHAMKGPDLQVTPLDVTLETSVFPLNIMLAERAGTLQAAIRFDTRLFDEHAIDQLWEAFRTLLGGMLDRPAAALAQLPLLSEREQQRVRALGCRVLTFDPSVRIHHAVERRAARTPNRVCLSSADEERTYGQLNTRANQLARFFADRLEVQPGEVVALVMDRSIVMVESILALWKLGAAYLPVDPGYPPSFIRSLVESSRVRALALDPSRVSPEHAGPLGQDRRVVEVTADSASDQDGSDLPGTTDDAALAYVIYTSGSTGVPKGVLVEHLGMLNHLHAKIVDLALSDASVVAQNASNSFDISVWQMFAALFVGGRTVIYQPALQLDPLRFAAHLDADRVTVLEVVPSYLDTMLDAWQRSDRPVAVDSLEYLVVTGEPAPPRLVNRWLGQFPKTPVMNAYGPTEASDDITHHLVTDLVETDSVPLGRPIPNTLVYVLDEQLRMCPQGVRGEIFVSGTGVARGYLHAPEQTAQVFMSDPFEPGRRMYRTGDNGRWSPEGTLEYLGRTDAQVKVRGFRVDLGEVERRVSQCPGVRTAAVVARKGATDQLRGYVVLEADGSLSRCRSHLSRELPHHMVPAELVEIEQLPLTANGKVDRNALHQLDGPRTRPAAADQPRSDTERTLTEIWEQVLGLAGLATTDRFFDLGGNSLRAVQVVSRIRSQLGVELDLEALFSHPTIAELAGLVSAAHTRALEPIPSLGGPGRYHIASSQHLLLQVDRVVAQRAAFNRNDLFELRGDVDPALLERSFELVLERHESLRTTFEAVAGKPAQVVHAPGALALPFSVHDFSPEVDPAAAARQFVQSRVRQPFQTATEPLIRADLLRTGETSFSLLVSMHQLVSDGRSVEVLLNDWLGYYDALLDGRDPTLPDLPFQYKDAAHWRDARMTPERLRAHREFWRHALDGASSMVPVRTDRPRPPVAALTGARLRLAVPPTLTDRLAALARDQGVTEFVVYRCAVGLLLLAETGLTDVTVGTYTRGRSRLDLEDQIGFYINTVPLRLQLRPGDDVRSVLTRAQHDVLQAFQHEDYPYEWTMRELGWHRGPDRSPLFDVMVAMDEVGKATGGNAAGRHRLHLEPRELPRRSKEADLLFAFWRSATSLEIALTYNTELFTADLAKQCAVRLRTLLEEMVDDRPVVQILSRKVAPA